MSFDPLARVFTLAEVISATGCHPKSVMNWVERGIVKLGGQNPGKGQRRKFSAHDAAILAVMCRLTRYGVLPGQAHFFAVMAAYCIATGRELNLDDHMIIRAHPEASRGQTFPDGKGLHVEQPCTKDANTLTVSEIFAFASLTERDEDCDALVISTGRLIHRVVSRLRSIWEQEILQTEVATPAEGSA